MTSPFDWIDKDNHDQINFVKKYIARRTTAGSMPNSLTQHLNSNAFQGLHECLKTLSNDAVNREVSRQMKGAWKTLQHRRKNGNPVSLQMPKNSLKTLNTLAKKRGQSQGRTLSQIITEAMDNQKIGSAQALRNQEKLKDQLDKQHEKTQQMEQAYKLMVNSLMNTLAEEVSYRCRLEAFVGGWEDTPLENDEKQLYLNLVEKSISEVESNISNFTSLSSYIIPTFRVRMDQQAIINGLKESETGLL
tara:strand:+ start:30121 stop:30861 length:741 start_codon:yes stop_codon:yes gene_type:complete